MTKQVALAITLLVCASASTSAQTATTFKLAYYNIQSGKGEPPLSGRTSTFVDSSNCTDLTQPLNAWGVGFVQRHLQQSVGNDPAIVALGLGEAWPCATPARVAQALGWKGVSSERNGVAMLARFGFAGPEQWHQLDTTLNENPNDTMWVLRIPVCLDAGCSASASVAVAHWFTNEGNPLAEASYDRQGAGTVAFLQQKAAVPHVLLGDLNNWEATASKVCNQVPIATGLKHLRDAGYIDAWPHLHGPNEGFTGMINRAGCGTPEGYAWKRLDYAWSSGYAPLSMTRFGVVPAGEEAPSDHYGIIVEYAKGGTAPEPPPSTSAVDAVIYASHATAIAGNWRVVSDPTAAGGKAIENPDRGVPKGTSALAQPADFFEATFQAQAGRPYRLWMRGKAAANAWTNDSVFVQFSGSVSSAGEATWRIGSTAATVVSIEECSGCGLGGWGWSDNGYGTLGPLVYFAQTGSQTIRVQSREDGVFIDQIVLSPEKYLAAAPGLPKNDRTIVPLPSTTATPAPSSTLEIVRYASSATVVAGDWVRVTDASAAGGSALRNPDRAVPKLTAPLQFPTNYVEFTFDAEAGRPYRMWLRGRADANSWANDSVFVQFAGSVTATGVPTWRIGSTDGTWIGIEDCSGCGLSGWGWQDNGYGAGVLGPLVYFGTTGPQTLRIQQREDGVTIDQAVLSAERYLTTRPGVTKNDSTIVPR